MLFRSEDRIPVDDKSIGRIYLIPDNPRANPEALEAIKSAEIIILGPGSLFTSIIPNLLIKEISEEIYKKNVLKIYICNVMTQNGETNGFTAADHMDVLLKHTNKGIVNCCLVNSGRLDYDLLFKYSQEKSFPVIPDENRLCQMGINVIEDDLVNKVDYLRHNSSKTARVIMHIYNTWKRKWKKYQKKL